MYDANDANNLVIAPNSTETYVVPVFTGISPEFNMADNISIQTADGVQDQVALAYNIPGNKLSILSPDVNILPEANYTTDYNQTGSGPYIPNPAPIGRFYENVNNKSVLYSNGTLQLTVQNNGNSMVGIQNVYVNGTNVDFTVDQDKYFPMPGDTCVIRAQVNPMPDNTPLSVFVTAEGEEGPGQGTGLCALDGMYLVSRNSSSAVQIITANNSTTAGFSNDSVQLVVKNTGSYDVNLTKLLFNGNYQVSLNDVNSSTGSMELQPGEVTIVNANFGGLGTGFIKYNMTQTMQTTILTNSSAQDTENLTAIQPTIDDKLQAFGSNATDQYAVYGVSYASYPLQPNFHILLQSTYVNETLNIIGVTISSETENATNIPLSQIQFYDNSKNYPGLSTL